MAEFNTENDVKRPEGSFIAEDRITHRTLTTIVGQLRPLLDRMRVTDLNFIRQSIQENVKAVINCCKKQFDLMDEFDKHLKNGKSHRNKIFMCQLCNREIDISNALAHLENHEMGIFTCIFCKFGTSKIDNYKIHMSERHSSMLPYVCVRLRLDQGREKGNSSAEPFLTCLPYRPSNRPYVPSTSVLKSGTSDNGVLSSSEANKLTVVPYREWRHIYENDLPWNDFFSPTLRGLKKRKLSQTQPTTSLSDIIDASNILVAETGLEDRELYICICGLNLENPFAFNNHFVNLHCNSREFKCSHCEEKYKSYGLLCRHIEDHGTHRYICGICLKTSVTENEIRAHFRFKHNNQVKGEMITLKSNERIVVEIVKHKFVLLEHGTEDEKIKFDVMLLKQCEKKKQPKQSFPRQFQL